MSPFEYEYKTFTGCRKEARRQVRHWLAEPGFWQRVTHCFLWRPSGLERIGKPRRRSVWVSEVEAIPDAAAVARAVAIVFFKPER